MTVNAISATNTAAATAVTQAAESMGKDAFLKLLITQLQNQDPLNPTDSTEFTAQLAQFSSLEQLSNVNANLTRLEQYQASINNAQAVSFIGKEIVSKGNSIDITSAGQAAACDFELAADAPHVTVTVYDATGGFVTDFEANSLSAGKHTLAWDGRDRSGGMVPAGTYSFEVIAEGVDGRRIGTTTYAKGTVTGVTFENGETYLLAGSGKVAIGDVTRISQTAKEN